ncbi:tetratricopeptide repeat protein [bacterium]|nr:tetratricopeptide repeat protein [bacterium]
MFSWVKNIYKNIKDLNFSVDKYKSDSIIQSLPTVAYVNKAKKLINCQKYEEAENILNKALAISDQDDLIYKYLGKIYEQSAKFEQAAEYYNKSASLNPQDKEIWLRLGMCQLNCEKTDDALISFERANKVTPFNTDVQTGWGMGLMKQKKYALARDKFLSAIKISKYNFTAILLSAVMEIKLNDYESAEMKLKFLAKVAPNEGSLYEYANLKLLKSDYDEAIKYAKKVLEINNKMLPAYFVLGEIYSIKKNKENTENIFQKAIYNGLDDASLHFEWGRAYIRLFEFKKAKEQFLTALEQREAYLGPKIGLALVNAHEKDFTILDELKEKYGENVYIQEAIGLEKLDKGLTQDAIEMFKKALRIDPKQTYNYYNIAKAYKILNDSNKVREFYEKFVRENPDFLKGLIDYSKWLISISDYADAQRKLRRAEKLDSNNSEILNLLFFTSYTLVKNNICEYNIKEAISIAEKAQATEKFDYNNEKTELEQILKNIQGSN